MKDMPPPPHLPKQTNEQKQAGKILVPESLIKKFLLLEKLLFLIEGRIHLILVTMMIYAFLK